MAHATPKKSSRAFQRRCLPFDRVSPITPVGTTECRWVDGRRHCSPPLINWECRMEFTRLTKNLPRPRWAKTGKRGAEQQRASACNAANTLPTAAPVVFGPCKGCKQHPEQLPLLYGCPLKGTTPAHHRVTTSMCFPRTMSHSSPNGSFAAGTRPLLLTHLTMCTLQTRFEISQLLSTKPIKVPGMSSLILL